MGMEPYALPEWACRDPGWEWEPSALPEWLQDEKRSLQRSDDANFDSGDSSNSLFVGLGNS
jgi:hypothetical protein